MWASRRGTQARGKGAVPLLTTLGFKYCREVCLNMLLFNLAIFANLNCADHWNFSVGQAGQAVSHTVSAPTRVCIDWRTAS